MKLQFKVQQYQTDAVDAVVECFSGQPRRMGDSYVIDPGTRPVSAQIKLEFEKRVDSGLRNAAIELTPEQLLRNVQRVQRDRQLTVSAELAHSQAAARGVPNLDVEMETGTGKTYVYIKTMMEMNKRYGWSKYIVVVPSIAIREGVQKSFDLTAEHFLQNYGIKPRSFIYNSSKLHELEQFSSDAGVQVMIINIQAFNSTSKDNRRIYDVLDDFQSRRPIDVISANRPIIIMDEPQRIGAPKTLESLSNFNALAVLRYSATHRVEHNKVYRLDALDAYNQKLVKKIAVRGITVKGLAGSTAYLYLDAIEVSRDARPKARLEIEVQTSTGIRRQIKRLDKGTDLHVISGRIEAYKDLFIVDVDANRDVIELSNGEVLAAGQLTEDVTEDARRRIQIREVIRAHLEKERQLHAQDIKVLSLCFIDAVSKYRDYRREDTLGEYARMFEEEYAALVSEELGTLAFSPGAEEYRSYLQDISVRDTHQGYFSIDKRTNRQVDPSVARRGDEVGQSTDSDAYDLILRDKERLLSFEEPVRFIFSHSALREGWDNPNVFVMGMLKRSDSTISRHQEIGRGLRLAVNQSGERQDDPTTVHDINELTVVTDESYTDFVAGLQREISESLKARPRYATSESFAEKLVKTACQGDHKLTIEDSRKFYNHLVRHDYVDDAGLVTEKYMQARESATLVVPTSSVFDTLGIDVFQLVDQLLQDVPTPIDGRKPKLIPLNQTNFEKREFRELWSRINHKVVYQVNFDSAELIDKCVRALDGHLHVTQMQYVVKAGEQRTVVDEDKLASGDGFKLSSTTTHVVESAGSQVPYDLLGELSEKTKLTRKTSAAILGGVSSGTFEKYRHNPEQFIVEAARLINEQKATMIVEHLSYDTLSERYDVAIFTDNQSKQDFAKAGDKLKKHVYDYVVTDSQRERDFVTELDTSNEVVVYAKLPRGFFIPTPVGNYNPDWAIAFNSGAVKHLYFVAETKGSLSSLQLRGVEEAKIECARRLFAQLSERANGSVKYDVVTDYGQLMQLVRA